MASYIIRIQDAERELWAKFKARAQSEGRALRWLLLELIKRYVENGLD